MANNTTRYPPPLNSQVFPGFSIPFSFQGQGYQGQAYTGGAGMNAAFASLQCFSGDQRVRTPRGIVRMDRLRVGDLVLTMDQSLLSFSPVVMFLHRKPPEMATYIQVQVWANLKNWENWGLGPIRFFAIYRFGQIFGAQKWISLLLVPFHRFTPMAGIL